MRSTAWHGDVLASYSLNEYQAANEITIIVAWERGTARFEANKMAFNESVWGSVDGTRNPAIRAR